MIDLEQFKDLVIEPTLEELGLYSVAAAELVLGTAIQESRLTYIKQLGGGPALGLFQMEPATHDDIFTNWLIYRPDLLSRVRSMTVLRENPSLEMVWNMRYACAMCRIHYRRKREPLPPAGDRPGQAAYWKEHYNTHLGKGTEEEYIHNWETIHGS